MQSLSWYSHIANISFFSILPFDSLYYITYETPDVSSSLFCSINWHVMLHFEVFRFFLFVYDIFAFVFNHFFSLFSRFSFVSISIIFSF